MAGEAHTGMTWESGAVMTPDEVRIEASAVGPPALMDIGLTELLQSTTGGWATPFVPRPAIRGVGRHLVLDRYGVRHFDQTPKRMFLRRNTNPRLDFAVPFAELGHVGLQIQRSRTTPLQQIRLILGPLDPDGFAARRPELEILRNAEGLSPAYWAISMGRYFAELDRTVLDTANQALIRFAGARYPGHVV